MTVPAGRQESERAKWGRVGRVLSVCGGVMLVAVAVVFVARSSTLSDQNSSLQTDNQHVAAQAQVAGAKASEGISLAQQLVQVCTAGGPDLDQLRAAGLCAQAQQVQQPLVTQVAPASDGQIAARVAIYLAAHPPPAGRPPTEGEILAAVAQVYAQNKPADGKNPSSADILAVIGSFCAGASDPCRGAPGLDGKNGADGAVGAAGQNGSNGANGDSFVDLNFVTQSDGSCDAVVILTDGASGTQRTLSHPVNPVVCQPAPPPPSSTPPPPTS